MNRRTVVVAILFIILLRILLFFPQALAFLLIAGLGLAVLTVTLYAIIKIGKGIYMLYRTHILKNADDYWLENGYLVTKGALGEKQKYLDMIYTTPDLNQERIAELFYNRLEDEGISEAAEVDVEERFEPGKIGGSMMKELGKEFPPRMEEIGLSANEKNIRRFLEQLSEKTDTDILEEVNIKEITKSKDEVPSHRIVVDEENKIKVSRYLPADYQMKQINDSLLKPLNLDIRIYSFGNGVSGALTEEEAEKIGEIMRKEPVLND
ncbi:MAG: hypothetical protein ACI9LV_000705 [Candidatus Nanohaloarchaea archaeon]|jgi:hypothetical protein